MTPRIGSLFSGYGGLDLAVEAELEATVAWHCEYDDGPSKILAHHWPKIPNYGDITLMDWKAVEHVEILTGGYPCQPFSRVGKRAGVDDVRHLWPYVWEAIRCLRPQVAILENVAGHRSLGFDRVLGDLAEVGYDARWTSVRASDVGAFHHRERVFIVAYPKGIRRQERHSAMHPGDDLAPAQWVRSPARSLGGLLRRWGTVVGREHPEPLRTGVFTGNAANPRFWEWAMGLTEGHISDVPDLTHWQKIKAAGNGVVPQQARAALRLLNVRELVAS